LEGKLQEVYRTFKRKKQQKKRWGDQNEIEKD